MPRHYRFRFRENLPPGASNNQFHPEHTLAGRFLDGVVKDHNDFTGPSQFAAALAMFPIYVKLAKELGYEMEAMRHITKPVKLSIRGGRGEYIVHCGSLAFGKLERYDPSSPDDMCDLPKTLDEI